jgi:hypothetical protein
MRKLNLMRPFYVHSKLCRNSTVTVATYDKRIVESYIDKITAYNCNSLGLERCHCQLLILLLSSVFVDFKFKQEFFD